MLTLRLDISKPLQAAISQIVEAFGKQKRKRKKPRIVIERATLYDTHRGVREKILTLYNIPITGDKFMAETIQLNDLQEMDFELRGYNRRNQVVSIPGATFETSGGLVLATNEERTGDDGKPFQFVTVETPEGVGAGALTMVSDADPTDDIPALVASQGFVWGPPQEVVRAEFTAVGEARDVSEEEPEPTE